MEARQTLTPRIIRKIAVEYPHAAAMLSGLVGPVTATVVQGSGPVAVDLQQGSQVDRFGLQLDLPDVLSEFTQSAEFAQHEDYGPLLIFQEIPEAFFELQPPEGAGYMAGDEVTVRGWRCRLVSTQGYQYLFEALLRGPGRTVSSVGHFVEDISILRSFKALYFIRRADNVPASALAGTVAVQES